MTHTTPTPDLPQPAIHAPFLSEVRKVLRGDYFTANQMRAYGLACIAQAAPAGDAVLYVRQMDLDDNRGTVIASPSADEKWTVPLYLAATERAATQPAGLTEDELHEMWNDVLNGRPLNETKPHHVASFIRAIAHRLAAPIGEDAGECEDGPPLTMSVYGSLDAVEAERARRTPAAPSGSTEQPVAASVGVPEHPYGKGASWNSVERKAIQQYGQDCRRAAEKERDDLRAHVKVCDGLFDGVAKERDALRAQLTIKEADCSKWMALADSATQIEEFRAQRAQLARPADLAGLTRYAESSMVGGGIVEDGDGDWLLLADVQALLAGGA